MQIFKVNQGMWVFNRAVHTARVGQHALEQLIYQIVAGGDIWDNRK